MSKRAPPSSARLTFVAQPHADDRASASVPVHVGALRGGGSVDLKCAACGELVVVGGGVDLMLEYLFECPACESLVGLEVDTSQLGLVLLH